VSHDLRNPLSVASGHVQLLHEEFENDLESERERLEKVIHAHDRMEALIQDLLTLAQSGTQIRETKWIDFSALCETCWENVSTADATLEINVDGQIRADPSRLKQLMENLIRNAVDHGGDTVTVTIGDIDDQAGFTSLMTASASRKQSETAYSRAAFRRSQTGPDSDWRS